MDINVTATITQIEELEQIVKNLRELTAGTSANIILNINIQ